ncbi:MAG: 3-phosphoshikimate 1-carboxyvinyltransferase [Clostridia bacterium]|nr:3-phosphoshikimate 1-carboxyvinyltransferase [Clostridia bacterium]
MFVEPLKKFDKTLTCKPDKSVTHRAVMFNAMLDCGRATVKNPLISADVLSTTDCMKRLGAQIEVGEKTIEIVRGGIRKNAELDCGNSGTTMRLLTGLLAGCEGREVSLYGDESLSRRPMKRVADPLRKMGAQIDCIGLTPPLSVTGAKLKGIDYEMPVKSAQVKSALLLAGLFADGKTTVHEQSKSRDHTERMLRAMGASIEFDDKKACVVGGAKLHNVDVEVCGDISSAAFPFVLAAGGEGGRTTVKNVGINPTRTGIIDVLRAMGADVKTENIVEGFEPVADVTVRANTLRPIVVGGGLIPRLIDELPIIAVLCAVASGESVICDAAELKVKETDRIKTTVDMLTALGVEAVATDDGMRIYGRGRIEGGGVVDSCGDHRIAMAAAVAMSLSKKGGTLLNADACAVSYPDFFGNVLGLKGEE